MVNVSHSAAPTFALADATTWADPFRMYRALRDQDPVHHVVPADRPDHDYYVLSRHADIGPPHATTKPSRRRRA